MNEEKVNEIREEQIEINPKRNEFCSFIIDEIIVKEINNNESVEVQKGVLMVLSSSNHDYFQIIFEENKIVVVENFNDFDKSLKFWKSLKIKFGGGDGGYF